VFVCHLARNAANILKGKAKRATWGNLKTVAEIGALARERWIVPRSLTRPEFKAWSWDELATLLAVQRSRNGAAAPAVRMARK
jgi:hypothetical protein